MPESLYTPDNCHGSYRLTWSLAVFWQAPMSDASWLGELTSATETDDVRVLKHRFAGPAASQFLFSTTPAVAPSAAMRSVKGRLQHIVRGDRPKAFRRNYALHSIGSARREVVEEYVASQLGHHRMADPQVQEMLAQAQPTRRLADLSRVRRSAHGE